MLAGTEWVNGRTWKSVRQTRNKVGIDRAFETAFPKFEVQFGLINNFLSGQTLSLRNIRYAAKQVARLREFPAWVEDVAKQKEINYLDERVAEAFARLERREEKRAAKIGKTVRRRKTEPVAPGPPSPDQDIWSTL